MRVTGIDQGADSFVKAGVTSAAALDRATVGGATSSNGGVERRRLAAVCVACSVGMERRGNLAQSYASGRPVHPRKLTEPSRQSTGERSTARMSRRYLIRALPVLAAAHVS